ncbi:A24 family peptidase [Patescibacteria group bacterium]|nr:A24 family peptidase [Patescibacteria group bacterium]
MTGLLAAVFFLLGAVAASFIGVVAARMHTGQSFVYGRSRCDACSAILPPRSLVPIVSFIAAGGRAGCCGALMSFYAPFSEILLGGLFLLSYLRIGLSPALPFFLIALSLMALLVLYDGRHQILPTLPLWFFVAASAAAGWMLTPSLEDFITAIEIASFLALFIGSIHFFSRGRAMGFADAPFVLGCALLVGPAAAAGFLFSFWIGAAVGIAILARRPRGSRMGVEVPFAPFLAAGFLLAYFTQWNPFLFVAAIR